MQLSTSDSIQAQSTPDLMTKNINAIKPINREIVECMWSCEFYHNETCYLCNPCGAKVTPAIMWVIRYCEKDPD